MIENRYKWLYLENLTQEQEKRIEDYINSYLSAYNEYLILPNEENSLRLMTLSGPIDEAYNMTNPMLKNGKTYPAIELIKNKIDFQGKEIEKNFESNAEEKAYIKALKNNVGHPLNEDYQMEKNAYWQAPLIIGLTVIVGIILGSILFFIK